MHAAARTQQQRGGLRRGERAEDGNGGCNKRARRTGRTLPSRPPPRHAGRRPLRHPRQPPRPRGGARATSPATAAREIWCLGDLVGYGADPNDCVRLVREQRRGVPGRQPRPRRDGRAAAATSSRPAPRSPRAGRRRSSTRTASRGSRRWSRTATATRHRALPRQPARPGLGVRAERAARRPLLRRASSERIGLIGHTHVALLVRRAPRASRRPARRAAPTRPSTSRPARWLLNPGSVGQPRDGDPRAAWLLLDLDRRRPPPGGAPSYDIDGAAAAIRAARLPDSLAERLQYGQ